MQSKGQQLIKISNNIFDELRDEEQEVTYLVSMYFLLLTKADSLNTVESTLRMLREQLGYKANRPKEREKTAEILKILSKHGLIKIKKPGKKWNDRVEIEIEGRPSRDYHLIHPSNRNLLTSEIRHPTTVLSIYLLLLIKSFPKWQGRSEKTRISIARLAEELECHESAIIAGLDYLNEINIVNKYSGSYNEETQKRDTNIYYTYSWHAPADSEDKKKDNLEQDECFKRKEMILHLLNKREKLPSLLIGKYSVEFKRMLSELKDDFDIKSLNPGHRGEISDWEESYFGVSRVETITEINLNSIKKSNILENLLVLVEKYGDRVPIILYRDNDNIIPALKSRMFRVYKALPNLDEGVLNFKSAADTLKKVENFKRDYNINQGKVRKIISEDSPNLMSLGYSRGSDSNQRQIDSLISELGEGRTYKEVLNQKR